VSMTGKIERVEVITSLQRAAALVGGKESAKCRLSREVPSGFTGNLRMNSNFPHEADLMRQRNFIRCVARVLLCCCYSYCLFRCQELMRRLAQLFGLPSSLFLCMAVFPLRLTQVEAYVLDMFVLSAYPAPVLR